MNILLINHYAGSVQYGMEYRPYYIAREWVKSGHEVTIVAASCSHVRQQTPKVTGAVTEEMIDGIRYVWLRTPKYDGNGMGRLLNMLSFVTKLFWNGKAVVGVHKTDVVIASSTYPLDIFPARYLARCYKAKLVFEVHDLWPLSPMELGGMSKWHPFIMLMQWGENFACKNANAVVSMLPKTSEHLEAHGMNQKKFTYIPNGIVVDEWGKGNVYLPPEHIAAIKEKKREGNLIVGYTGAHGIANALDTLLDAAALLQSKKIVFFLVGQGAEKKRLMKRAMTERIENICFFPSVKKDAIPHVLQEMDMVYLGLKNEKLFRFGISPNKLMDYMMAAKPIVHSVNAGNDIVSECCCGVSVSPGSAEAVRDAILQIAALGEQGRDEMGARGQVYVMKNHDYSQLAQKFLEVCNE